MCNHVQQYRHSCKLSLAAAVSKPYKWLIILRKILLLQPIQRKLQTLILMQRMLPVWHSWMLVPVHDHVVLVHHPAEAKEGKTIRFLWGKKIFHLFMCCRALFGQLLSRVWKFKADSSFGIILNHLYWSIVQSEYRIKLSLIILDCGRSHGLRLRPCSTEYPSQITVNWLQSIASSK